MLGETRTRLRKQITVGIVARCSEIACSCGRLCEVADGVILVLRALTERISDRYAITDRIICDRDCIA